MKKIVINLFLIATLATVAVGCKKFLDINTDEDTPQNPDPTSVFPTQLAAIPRGIQYDARYLGKYIQNWLTGNNNNQNAFDLHGYAAGSDAQGDIWRMVYYGMGKNLEYIITESVKDERWDIAGAGVALKAFAFQTGTDYHGPMGFYDLYKDDKVFYQYTSQDTIYRAVDSLCRVAIDYLSRAAEPKGFPTLSRGDFVYNGDVNKWKKFTYGILARNWNHVSNKTSLYNADSVIKFCDNALADVNGTDDFLIPFSATKNDDANFFGPYRGNMGDVVSSVFHPYRASNFIVRLLDGSTFVGNTNGPARDPRMRHMLSASQDTTNGNGGYRGVDPGVGDPFSATTTGANARKRAASLWGDSVYVNPSSSVFSKSGKYLFRDKVVFPVMTYSEIQFIKAEAMFRKNDKTGALNAYRQGVLGHMRFINRDQFPLGNEILYNSQKISDVEINAYMNTSGAVKTVAADLNISDIMLQKYIALWGWGFVETWTDLRRYDYNVAIDPATNQSVYRGFRFPSSFASANGGKPAERVRPRFNSEYVWNIPELQRIGALSLNYHTLPMWFSEP